MDLEPNSNDLAKPSRQPSADGARSLTLKPVLSRKIHLGYLTKAMLGSQDDLIVADLGESEDRLVHGLRPDIDAFDLFHVIEPSDSADLDAGETSTTTAPPRCAVDGRILGTATDHRHALAVEAGEDQFTALPVGDMQAGLDVNNLEQHEWVYIVQRARAFDRPDAMLAREHVVGRHLRQAITVIGSRSKLHFETFEPSIARSLSASQQDLKTEFGASISGEFRKVPHVGGRADQGLRLEPLHQFHAPRCIIHTDRKHREPIVEGSMVFAAPSGQQ